MAKIKICGIRRNVDIEYVNALLPDYIGFILSDGFRRSISFDTAKKLKAGLDSKIKAVGVFVDDDIDKINSALSAGIIDLVQLHGSETAEYCKKINAPVIKYFKPDMFAHIDEYDTEYLLFDSGTGTGKAFDWSKIPKTDKPFFLAGGIGADNIQNALEQVNPYCVDLSSSVETDGYKDYNKIKQIMESVR
ncbi:MAG: phosphoribosylanthranilate isomerase [Clostridium sp.]|nr:phosphoribosylanthranilate isomerase [Clostridium sp.]